MASSQDTLNAWLHRNQMTPHQLSQTLGIDRWQISRYLAGEEELDAITSYALKGLANELAKGPADSPLPNPPHASLAEGLYGDKWAERTARLIIPILVDAATNGQRRVMTYTDVHEEVVRRGGEANVGRLTKYAFALGKVATAMEVLGQEDNLERFGGLVPPLTALVVSKQTGMPSKGIDSFVHYYLENSGREELAKRINTMQGRVDAFALVWNDVFNYKKWNVVLSSLGLTGNPDFDR